MKNTNVLTALTAAMLMGSVIPSKADISVEVFYESLDPYGVWIQTSDYGYVFQPSDLGQDWRPYTDGSWAYTDAGWTWVSEEPYGWATYHYGRWADLESVGWVWVPGTEWGPAWVSWRSSDDYVGWAPLPPAARFEARVGLGGWVDAHFDIGPSYFSFVRTRDLGAPRLRTVVVEPRENITIINNTRNITNITYVNNVVVNNGPRYEVVSRKAANPIRRLKLQRNAQLADGPDGRRGERLRAKVDGDALVVAAPAIQGGAQGAAPKKVARKLERVNVNRGWKNVGDDEKVRAVRAKMEAEEKAPVGAPAARIGQGGRDGEAAEAPGRAERPEMPDRPNRPERPGVAAGEPNPGAPDRDGKKPGKRGDRDDAEASVRTPPKPGDDGPGQNRRGPAGKRPGAEPAAPAEAMPDAPKPPAEPRVPRESPGPEGARREAPERPDRPGRPDRPERREMPDRPNRPERAERPERPNLPDRGERPGANREERGQRPGGAGGGERPQPKAGGGGGGGAKEDREDRRGPAGKEGGARIAINSRIRCA